MAAATALEQLDDVPLDSREIVLEKRDASVVIVHHTLLEFARRARARAAGTATLKGRCGRPREFICPPPSAADVRAI